MLFDVLSLWEIAHRWHDQDPNLSDPKALPIDVQDTLRWLTRMMSGHNLRICTKRGVEHDNQGDMLSKIEVLANHKDTNQIPEEKQWEIWEHYLDWHDTRVQFHCDAVEGLEECYENRKYDKERLDNTYTNQHGLAKTCEMHDIPLPKFWYPEGWDQISEKTPDKAPEKLKPNQLDKLVCQAIAQTIWYEHPDWNIVQVTKHIGIQKFGNGAQYKDKTLRLWVKEFDPRPPKTRRGRPKKEKKPKISEKP